MNKGVRVHRSGANSEPADSHVTTRCATRPHDRGLVYQQEPVSADAGDCFARHGVTELTSAMATFRELDLERLRLNG